MDGEDGTGAAVVSPESQGPPPANGEVADPSQTPEDLLHRPPMQDRSRRTLEKLVAAAARLLERHGPQGVTVTGVAGEARTSVGSFYARFASKEEMVRYLGERWLTEALKSWRESLESAGSQGSGLDALQGATAGLAALYLAGPARRLWLLHLEDDPAPTRLRRFEDAVAEDMAARGWFPARARSSSADEDRNGDLDEDDNWSPGVSAETRFLLALALVAAVRELASRATEGKGAAAGLGPGALAALLVNPLAIREDADTEEPARQERAPDREEEAQDDEEQPPEGGESESPEQAEDDPADFFDVWA